MFTKLSKSIYRYARANKYYNIIEFFSELQIQFSLIEITFLTKEHNDLSILITTIRPISLLINLRSSKLYDSLIDDTITLCIMNIILGIYLIIPLIALLSFIKTKYIIVPNITYSWISYFGYIHLYIITYIIHGWLTHQIKQSFTNEIINTVILVYSLTFMVINIIITIFICKACISQVYLPGFICHKFTNYRWMNLIFKSIFPIVQIIESSSIRNLIFLIFLTIWCIIRQVNLIIGNPYYSYKTIKLMSCMHGITSGIIFSNLIVFLLQIKFMKISSICGFILFFITSLICKWYMIISNHKINELFYKTEKLTDSDYVTQYCLIDQFTETCHKKGYIGQNIDKDEIISNGLLLSHQTICNECHNEKSLQAIRIHFMKTKILKGLNIHKNSLILNCLAMNFYLNQEHSSHLPCFLLEKLKKKSLFIEDKLMLRAFEIKIEEALHYASNDKHSEYGRFAVCETFYEKFLQEIKNVTESYFKFWSEINSTIPNLLNLIKYAIQIRRNHKKFKNGMLLYKSKFMDDFTKPLLLAGLYYDILKNNHEESFFMLQKYRKIMIQHSHANLANQITYNIYYSKDNVNIRISGADDSLGSIISYSGNITEITNLNGGKLIGKNISEILPNFFGACHNDFIREYKETGICKIINQTTHQFCKHEYGHLIPIRLNISIYPILDCGLMFLGMIRAIKTKHEYILINQDGYIEGMTLEISRDLNFKPYSKIHFFSILYSGKPNIHKEINLEIIASASLYTKSLLGSQFDHSLYSNLIDKKTATSSPGKNGSQLTSRIPHEPRYLFQNFVDDYSKEENSQNERKLILKKITDQNQQKIIDENNTKYEYIEYITSLEKNSYRFGLNIYKLKLRKCDNILQKKLNAKSGNPKSPLKISINNEDNLSIQEYDQEPYIPLIINQPFTKKPDFIRELISQSDYNKPNLLENKKVQDSTELQIKNKISFFSMNVFIPKTSYLIDGNSNTQGEVLLRKYSMSFQEENLTRKGIIITSYDEFDIDNNIDENYSIKNLRFNKNPKSKSQIQKQQKKVTKQFFRFRSIFLEMNKLMMIILFLIAIIGIFLMYSMNTTNISNIDRDLILSYHNNQRLASLVELDRRLRTVWLIKADLMSDTRHAWRNIKSYYTNSINKAIEASQYLINNNSLIAKEIPYIDNEFQNEFYSKSIKLYNIDNDGNKLPNYLKTDTFLAGYQISQIFNKIKKLAISQMNTNNTDLLFILRNSFNDLYIEYEKSAYIFVNEITLLIHDLQQTSLTILLIIVIISSICMILLMPGLSALFYKKRNLLMQIVNIKIQYCQSHLDRINQFLKGLQENYNDTQFINIYDENKLFHNEIESKKGEDQNNKKSITNTKKMVNTLGVKLDLTKSFLILLVIIAIYIVVFYIKKIMVGTYMENINTAIQRILFSSRMLAQQNFAMAIVYEYIGENGTTIVQNNPIDLAINQTMSSIGDLEGFLTNFRDEKGDLDPNLQFIMVGNICTIVPPDNAKDCVALGGGPGQNGISSINSYVYKALSTALTAFQSSNRTIQDANNTLWLWYLRDLEGIFSRITISTYTYLYNQLLEEFNSEIRSYQIFILAWTLFSFFSLLIIKILIWLPINRKLINEIISMRRIMKIIPKSIMEKGKFYNKN